MSKRATGLWPAYRPLLVLGAIAIAGLIGALVGDNAYDLLSWLALGALVAIAAVKSLKR